MGEFAGLTAVVTGGSRGIGYKTAERLLAGGASVAICSRTLETLKSAADELSRAHGRPVLWQTVDILDGDSILKFSERVGREFGSLNVLVNNAGESSQRTVDGVHWPVNSVDSPGQDLPRGRFEEMSDGEFREAFEQKCLGMIRVTRAFLPALRKAGAASVVNITSIKGIQPPPRVVTSGVAWAAAMNFSKALSFELAADGIRVNVVSVGGIMTPQMEAGRRRWAPEKTLEEFLSKRVANIPLKRLGLTDEVAEAIIFLARPGSAYITGQTIMVDGGGVRRF